MKFYVILKGSVGVNVKFLKINSEENEQAKLNNFSNNSVISAKLNPLLPDDFVLKEIKVLNAGVSFGELALIENKPRAATIICKEDCGFAVLDKKNFDLILSKNQN